MRVCVVGSAAGQPHTAEVTNEAVDASNARLCALKRHTGEHANLPAKAPFSVGEAEFTVLM